MTTDTYTAHRNAALDLLTAVQDIDPGPITTAERIALNLDAAQVHATLALAAATHDQAIETDLDALDPTDPITLTPTQNGHDEPPADWEIEIHRILATNPQALAGHARALARWFTTAVIEISRLTGTSEAVVRARITGSAS